uniref:Toll receptor 2 n=1 Tax=Macrobrachium rosenbergii TaxID=79674 RepID=W8PVP4_MACRS|nr:toll receptor 2 [Macrobrachium rosenbergii]
MAAWKCLPALLLLVWVAGGISTTTTTTTCGNCKENGNYVICRHSAGGDVYEVEVLMETELLLQCKPSTTNLNLTFMEGCSFPSVEQIKVYGCPLPNASFGELFFQMGVYPENVTTFGFYDRNERDRPLEGWHLDGLEGLLTLEFVNNDFLGLPVDLFTPTPSLRRIKVVSDSFSSLPESIFFNLPDLETLNFERNRLETLPPGLFTNLTALTNVTFSHNYLSSVDPDFFSDKVNLESLDLSHNQIASLERNIFENLGALRNLSMQGNLLESLPSGVFSKLLSLEVLDLSFNVLRQLPEKAFDRLIDVKNIDLSNNSLDELPSEAFSKCESLARLSLRHNNLRKLQAEMFPRQTSLTFLDLGHNNISFTVNSAKILQEGPVSYEGNFPLNSQIRLQELLMNDNKIDFIPSAINNIFVDLKKVDLSGNEITDFSYHSLVFYQDSVILNLKNNNISYVDFHEIYDLLNEKEVKLYLEGNNLFCDCRMYLFTRIVQGQPIRKMKIMDIEVEDIEKVTCRNHDGIQQLLSQVDSTQLYCVIPDVQCIRNCSCLWRAHDSMVIIDCSFLGLQELPDLSILSKPLTKISVTLDMKNNSLYTLKGLKDPQFANLVNLTVSNNKISFINESDIPTTLKVLDVRGNELTNIPEPVLEVLNATDMILSFSGNPWDCDCDFINFLNFLHTPSRKVTDFDEITCARGNVYLHDLTEYSLCPYFMQPMVIVTLVAIGAFLLFFAVFGTVSFYKYKQGIKVWLYAHRMCLWAITEDEMDADKKFDAFISYSHKDEEFVNTVLVPGLENGDPKYRICLHYRDWVPGEYIQNQILQSVEASRRTIVVLSSNFIESVWGQLEFKAAHSQALQDGTSRIIVIVYGEIPPESELDDKLQLYISTKTYVKWGDAKFWEKLRYFMPHPPKKLNN